MEQIEAVNEIIRKRLRFYNKKLKRVTEYEKKKDALDAEQKRLIGEKPVHETASSELEHLQPHINDVAAAIASKDEEIVALNDKVEQQQKQLAAARLTHFKELNYIYSVRHHERFSTLEGSVKRDAFEAFVQLVAGGDFAAIDKFRARSSDVLSEGHSATFADAADFVDEAEAAFEAHRRELRRQAEEKRRKEEEARRRAEEERLRKEEEARRAQYETVFRGKLPSTYASINFLSPMPQNQ